MEQVTPATPLPYACRCLISLALVGRVICLDYYITVI